jgi:hypothetical protein
LTRTSPPPFAEYERQIRFLPSITFITFDRNLCLSVTRE